MSKNRLDQIEKYLFYLFCLVIILFRIPSIYLIPFFKNSLLTTQAFARIIIVFIFLYVCLYKKLSLNKRVLNILIIAFFIFLSISIIQVVNIFAFIQIYKDYLLGMMAFICFHYFKKESKKIFWVLIIASFFNIIYQTLLYFLPISHNLFATIIYQNHWDLVEKKLIIEQKIYTETFDESFLSLLLVTVISKPISKKSVFLVFISLMITFLSLLSNIRTRILMTFINITLTVLVFIKNSILYSLLIVFLFINILLVADKVSLRFFSFSFVNRIQMDNQQMDVNTIISRVEQIKYSITIGLNTVHGIGLGNYYDYVVAPLSYKINKKITGWRFNNQISGIMYVHNNFASILAELGIFAFLTYISLIMVFIITDVKSWYLSNKYQKAIIISFWTIFSFGVFNPPISGSYQFLFWGLRGLLY